MTTAGFPRAFTALALLAVLAATPAAAQARPLKPAASKLFGPAPERPPATRIPSQPARDSTSSNGALDGALVGAGIVGVLGLVAGAAFCDDGCNSGAKWQSGFSGLLLGAAVGFALGGIVGSL
ncbi:MAG TPA: hypothetical protein VFI39_08990 [Gemmatimonadales bacterium]|nr:hypothetical protein [Gemmatimonadales bacterium]